MVYVVVYVYTCILYFLSRTSFFLLSLQQEAQAQLQQTKSECISETYYDDISETINAYVQCTCICTGFMSRLEPIVVIVIIVKTPTEVYRQIQT